MRDVCVIGGGAAGMLAAIRLESAGLNVTVVEKTERLGKKLLLTGSGRCNIFNRNLTEFSYNSDFANGAIKKHTPARLADFFERLGLPTVTDHAGRAYPVADSAAAVLNVFLAHLTKTELKTGFGVSKISRVESGFEIFSDTGEKLCSKFLIFATGSPATIGFDSLHLLKRLRHTATTFRPSLCPIYVDKFFLKGLKNMRVKTRVSYGDFEELGELQFRDDAISGIAAFQLSELINRTTKPHTIKLDMLPSIELGVAEKTLSSPAGLYGLFHPQTARALQGFSVAVLKNREIRPLGLYPMRSATIAHGGLNTNKFDSLTMQSLLVDRLYAIGEALDVSGLSGGFNLMWAWASALAAAEDIIKKCLR